ncbi:MAG: ISAs1 family transposase, partial [Thiotrichaceae bacterium]|nr:ISAs1 family transposase [Thiotrichaceae bacterium]
IRHVALNMLKAEKITKRGIKNKWLKAAWDTKYLMKVLANPSQTSDSS